MSVTFIRGDITKLKVDAIVNAANNELRGGGGVDGAIHAAAGEEQLHAFCRTLGGCPTGEAKLSPGFNLPAKYIIHTVGPVWQGGAFHEKMLLTSCYLRSLELAQQNNCKTVAFPLISAGAYGYPYDDALQIAYDTCQRFLKETNADMEIYIVLYQRRPGHVANTRQQIDYSKLPDGDVFRLVAEYIRDNYHFDAEIADYKDSAPKKRIATKAVRKKTAAKAVEKRGPSKEEPCASPEGAAFYEDAAFSMPLPEPVQSKEAPPVPPKAERRFQESDLLTGHVAYSAKIPHMGDFRTEETFTQMLIRFMREKNMDPPEVYNNACLDRKLFSKILSNVDYQPKKYTAVRLALALQLDSEETENLLNAAGYALSRSKLTDLVISYCVANNIRTVWDVNGALENFGLTTI